MPLRGALTWALALVLPFYGCAAGGSSRVEDGGDAGHDGDVDPAEVSPDVADQLVNEETGGAPDAGPDDPGDAGPDTNPDTESLCPGPEAYVGGAWPVMLNVKEDTCLLVPSREGQALDLAFQSKAVVRIAPGDYPVPGSEGVFPLRLPVCVRFESGERLVFGDPGEALVENFGERYWIKLQQPLRDGSGALWVLNLYLDGTAAGVTPLEGYFMHDELMEPMFLSNAAALDGRRHTVEFAGGTLTSDFLMTWGGDPSYGLLLAATGELDGISFTQQDYWRLALSNNHHFFSADWAVLFPSPVGGACGLLVTDGALVWEEGTIKVTRIDCGLGSLGERAVTRQESVVIKREAAICPRID